MKHLGFTVLVVGLAAVAGREAGAHTVGLSRGDYRVSGATVHAELTFACAELTAAVPALDGNHDGHVSAEELGTARPALAGAIVSRLEIRGAERACPGRLEDASLTEQDGVELVAAFDCGAVAGPLSVRLGFLDALSLGHRHLAAVAGRDGSVERLTAYEALPEFALGHAEAAAPGGVALPLFRLGIQHILTGYDHLLFLVGLILVGGRLRSHMVVVSSFTLAHSVTLGLAALGVWAPSPRVVEPAIALSIAYVGVENWFVRDTRRRWMITFPFGLIHGFGFAGALREVALPSGQVPLALASFNAGVETGQLAVLCLVLPAVLWLGRRAWFADRGVKALSTGVAVAGLVWFVARLA